jgi:hypothetical protein
MIEGYSYEVLVDGAMVFRYKDVFAARDGVEKARIMVKGDGNEGRIMVLDVGAGLLCTPDFIKAYCKVSAHINRCFIGRRDAGKTAEELARLFESGEATQFPSPQ